MNKYYKDYIALLEKEKYILKAVVTSHLDIPVIDMSFQDRLMVVDTQKRLLNVTAELESKKAMLAEYEARKKEQQAAEKQLENVVSKSLLEAINKSKNLLQDLSTGKEYRDSIKHIHERFGKGFDGNQTEKNQAFLMLVSILERHGVTLKDYPAVIR